MILVTGATGFVGTALCGALLAARRPFRALIRSHEKARSRGLDAAHCVQGDLAGDLKGALDGVQQVVHLAGLVRARSAAELLAINRDGTARLAAAAHAAGVARFVQVSSLAAAGPSVDGTGSACLPVAARPVSDYGRSKLAGEQALVAADVPWLILRPSVVYGPWDTDVRVLFELVRRRLVPIVGAELRYSLVHVDDLARAIVAALDAELVGACLPIAHAEVLTQRAWLERLARAVGSEPRFVELPRAAGWLAAHAGEAWARVHGRAALFGRDKLRELRAGSWVADPEPAAATLGFRATVDHDRGFAATAAWLRANA